MQAAAGNDDAAPVKIEIQYKPRQVYEFYIFHIMPDNRRNRIMGRLPEGHKDNMPAGKDMATKIRNLNRSAEINLLWQDKHFCPPQAGEMKQQNAQGKKNKTKGQKAPPN
jgi:hypothetical protein